MPAVSVIMLAWNSGAHLDEAVGSILGQTMSDLEVVLVDNGTTDGSVDELLRRRQDARLHVFRQGKNLGIALGTNLGISQARGSWIAMMDCDDRAHPMRLEMELSAATADPSLDVITTGAVWMDETGRTHGCFPVFYEPKEISAYVPFHCPILHPTVLARAGVFAAVNYRPEAELACDYDWVSRVVERFKIGCVSLPLLHYRKHGGSASINRTAYHQAMICAVRLAIARRRAGKEEDFGGLCADATRWSGSPGEMNEIYVHFAQRARADGFDLLAAFHAALACRVCPTAGNYFRFIRYLCTAVRRDRGAWREALAGAGKGPFWVMLKRAGFPPFPRY